MKTLTLILVWAYCKVCAFVSLTIDNSKHRCQILSELLLAAALKNFGSNDMKLKTFLASYEHVLISCCLSFEVFCGSIF